MQRCCKSSTYHLPHPQHSRSRASPSTFKHLRSSHCRLSAFKKACPFEFTRHVRLQADTEFGHLFCRTSVSQCDFNTGNSGFQVEEGMRLCKCLLRPGHATLQMPLRPRACDFTKAHNLSRSASPSPQPAWPLLWLPRHSHPAPRQHPCAVS